MRDLGRPLRILQVHNHHAVLGGAMEVLDHDRQMLQGAGYEVEQLTMPPADELNISAARQGAKAVWNREFAARTEHVIRQFHPDVAHVHTPFPLVSPAVFRATHGAGVPTVNTVHSFRLSCIAATCFRDGHICEDCVGRRVKWPAVLHRCYHESTLGSAALAAGITVHRAVGTFSRCVDRYLTMTGFAKRVLVRDGIPTSRIVVKPNSVPDPGVPDRRPGAGAPYVLWAGRLVGVKGIRTLLDAWPRAVVGSLRLVIAGDGEERLQVAAFAATDPRVDFLGWVSEQKVTDLMANATATLVTSEWYEAGAPLVALRSLSVGTPLLSCDLENVSAEIVEDGAALTYRTSDVESLVRLLNEVAAGPERLHAMRPVARAAYVTRYSPKVDLRRLTEVYAGVVRQT